MFQPHQTCQNNKPSWFYLEFCAVALSNFSLLDFQRLELFLCVFCNQKTMFIKYCILFWSFCNSQVPKIPLFSFFFGHSKFIPEKGARGAPGKKNSQWGEKTKFSLHCVCCYTQKSVLNSKKNVPASPNLPKQQAQLVLPGVLCCSII